MSDIEISIVTKTCKRCSEEKPITEFSIDRRMKYGHTSKCKKCSAIYKKAYDEKNNEHKSNYNKVWYENNKENIAERVKLWREENKEYRHAYNKVWYEENKNRKNYLDRIKKYREDNKERMAYIYKNWKNANKDKCASYRRARRARKHEATGTHTIDDINNLFKLQRKKCASCNKSISKYYEVDHIVALVNGGSNDKSNLQLLCMTCNRSKGSRDSIAFMNENGKLI